MFPVTKRCPICSERTTSAAGAIIFVVGISKVSINLGENVQLSGMVLATLAGMILSLIFYILEKLKLTNE
jgi:uracil permease